MIGQDRFDRLYRAPDRTNVSLDMIESEGTYYLLSKFDEDRRAVNEDNRDTIYGLNLTNLDKKGSINWSRDYIFYEDSSAVELEGSLILIEEGIMISGVIVDTLAKLSSVVLGLGSTGLVDFASAYGSNTEDALTVGNSLISNALDPEEVFLFGSNLTDTGKSLYASKIGLDGSLIWAADLHAQDTLGNDFEEEIAGQVFAYDSSYLAVGSLGDGSIFLLNHDENANLTYSRSYKTTGNFQTEVSGAVSMPDSTIFLSAYITNNNGNTTGGIIKLDSLGNLLWSKQLTAALGLGTITINDIVSNQSGQIIIAGNIEAPDVLGAIDAGEFIMLMSSDGLIIDQRSFQIIDGRGSLRAGALASTSDDGYAYFTTSYDEDRSTADSLMIRLIKTDAMINLDNLIDGNSCHSDLTGLLINDLSYRQDTLVWTATALDNRIDTIEVLERGFNYDVQVLALQDTMFCPGDPVEFELDATTRGAVAYRWFKADDPDNVIGTDSVFVATEIDVDYVAQVKIEDDNCFTLCDTTRLTEIMPPMVSIGSNNGQLCVNNQIVLIAQAEGADRVEWSTNETTPQILISEPGTYSVLVTNECDDTAEASIGISEEDFYQIGGGAATVDLENCSNGVVPIFLETTGDVISISWDNGASGPAITVSQAGVYTATITDLCGETVEVSAEVTPAEIFGCSEGDCPDGSSATDNGCLCWPNAFVPASQSEANATFGPNNRCPGITSYNLRIYNRWGEKVFESDEVGREWTGQRGSKLSPSEVYAFYVVYEVEGVEIKDKGNLTLIR